MLTYASGAAFIDRTGAVLVADPGFLAALGLAEGDPTGALRLRAEESPELRALLRGDGPDLLRLQRGEEEAVELSRHSAPAGALLLVRTGKLQDRIEHGFRSQALSRLVAGVAHDIKNPLNAMALQLAILSEKLSVQPEVGAVSGAHLTSIREQIGRVNEVLRRFLDVADPSAPMGYTELGGLLQDAAALFAHEARRRRIELVLEGARGAPRTGGDPARVGRLVLVLLAGAMAAMPDGGRLEAALGAEEGKAVLRVTHALGDGAAETGYDQGVGAAAASALGGTLTEERTDGVNRLVLRLPGIERA